MKQYKLEGAEKLRPTLKIRQYLTFNMQNAYVRDILFGLKS